MLPLLLGAGAALFAVRGHQARAHLDQLVLDRPVIELPRQRTSAGSTADSPDRGDDLGGTRRLLARDGDHDLAGVLLCAEATERLGQLLEGTHRVDDG